MIIHFRGGPFNFSNWVNWGFIGLSLFCFFNSNGQENTQAKAIFQTAYRAQIDTARAMLERKDYSASVAIAQSILDDLRGCLELVPDDYCDVLYVLGRAHYNLKNYLIAQSFVQEHIDRCQPGNKLLDFLQFYIILLNCHEFLGNSSLAKQALVKCTGIFQGYEFADLKFYEIQEFKALFNLLRILGRKVRDSYSDYTQAVAIFEKTMLLYSKCGISEPDIYTMLLTDIGYSYFLLRKYENASKYYQEAEQFVKQQQAISISTHAYVCSLLGKYYLHQRNFKLAEQYFEQGLQLMASAPANENRSYPFHLSNYGMYCDSMRDHAKAIFYFEKALQLAPIMDGKPTEWHGAINLYIGRAKMSLGLYNEAIRHFEEDQHILLSKYDQNYYKLFYSLEGIGEAYYRWGIETLQNIYFEKSLESFHKGFDLIKYFVSTSPDEKIKKSVLSRSSAYCGKFLLALSHIVRNQSNDSLLVRCWEVSEFMHNSIVLLNLLEAQSIRGSHIPDSLLLMQENLKLHINELDYRIQETSNKKNYVVTDPVILKQKNLLNYLRDSLKVMIAKMNLECPLARRDSSQLDYIRPRSLQDALSPSQTVLEYFSLDSVLFIFVVNRREFTLKIVRLNESLESLVKQFNSSITSYYINPSGNSLDFKQQLKNYTEAASKLYHYLIAPVNSSLSKELIIIPDALLGKLAFDALLNEQPNYFINFNTYSFLIKQYVISYHFSATTLIKMKELKHIDYNLGEFAGFAPFCEELSEQNASPNKEADNEKSSLSILKYSGEEILTIAKKFQNRSAMFLGASASREMFLKTAPLYRVLHVATHGQADFEEGKFSYLAFNGSKWGTDDQNVMGADLQALGLKAEMVVLSACETATGEYHSGNGIISLCSSIASTGVKSIVSTLWKVNDKSTMQIMDLFYSALKDGKPKNEALHEAKLNWLRTSHSYAKHPFFWAGFVLYGDTRRMF